jgi:hypothetical protein
MIKTAYNSSAEFYERFLLNSYQDRPIPGLASKQTSTAVKSKVKSQKSKVSYIKAFARLKWYVHLRRVVLECPTR